MKFVKSIALLLVSFTSFSQIDQEARFEILLSENDIHENYSVSSLADQGLLVYRRLFGQREDQLELIKLDTTLIENWRGYIALQKKLQVSHVKVHDQVVFILLKSGNYTSGDFQVVAIKADDGTYKVYTIKNLIPFNPTDFIVTSYGMMLGGYFNYRPLVLYFSFQTERSKILPGLFNEQGELTQIKPYDNGFVDVIISAKNFERKKCLWIRNYDAEADLVKTTVLAPEANKNLIFGRSVKMPNDEEVVAGVYGNRNVEYSRGIFVANINRLGEYHITYYNFSELQNFFSYMKVRREKRVKERIERRKIKGKKIRFNYRLLVQEVIPYENQFIMLGEAFYPRYTYTGTRGNSFGFSSFYSNPLTRGDRIFDGYQYTHAIVIGFDAQGKLKWDNSFEINDVKSFDLQQYVKIAPSKNQISLVYFYDNLIRSKIIKDNQVLEGKTADPLKSRFETDLIKKNDTQTSKLDYWYAHHFFASGIQKVRNQQVEDLYRKVFFINKIKY
ncbi:MAG: hypothetical protein JNM78_04180 [Cyclobacteriaceae bacterium]|nr:hypothetical protein [Cyclobacteriaceae bacterium]